MTTKCKYIFKEEENELILWFKDNNFRKGLFMSKAFSKDFYNFGDLINGVFKLAESSKPVKFINHIIETSTINFK